MTNKEFLSRIWSNEDQMTADTYRWVNHNYPSLRKLFFHIPNGGARDAREGQKFKSMGLLPGAPDFICLMPLFALELKMPNGRLSLDQKIVHQVWGKNNIPVHTAWNAQDVITIISKYAENNN